MNIDATHERFSPLLVAEPRPLLGDILERNPSKQGRLCISLNRTQNNKQFSFLGAGLSPHKVRTGYEGTQPETLQFSGLPQPPGLGRMHHHAMHHTNTTLVP